MKRLAYILTFIFIAFIATPSIVAYIDNSVDVSFAFNVNEEESSSKNQINLEFNVEEQHTNYASIHFLQEQDYTGDFYTESYPVVFLDVIFPPPKNA
ncbi:hypothetical protein LB465_02150 [Salegentibacter sp. LM13S]|uniref:hypothetical protein n=1 Tax=Salegentibacter lacus TaxID=2873599 RepID=UPI001CCC35ED|nr:hypothetical protein [Salegentibacter lacus]MBZ9629566.1 hypothetical protein [Salegentibacter lacus]